MYDLNHDKNRLKIINHKIIDFIEYCFIEFFEQTIDFNDINFSVLDIHLEELQVKFLALIVNNRKNIFLISFWQTFLKH